MTSVECTFTLMLITYGALLLLIGAPEVVRCHQRRKQQ